MSAQTRDPFERYPDGDIAESIFSTQKSVDRYTAAVTATEADVLELEAQRTVAQQAWEDDKRAHPDRPGYEQPSWEPMLRANHRAGVARYELLPTLRMKLDVWTRANRSWVREAARRATAATDTQA